MKHLVKHLAIATLALTGLATVGSAQTGLVSPAARIRQGVRDGSLTRTEALRLRGQNRRLRRQVARDRRDGGGLRRAEAARILAQARRNSRRIARLRNNRRTR